MKYITLVKIVESVDRYYRCYIVILILNESDQSSKSDCLVWSYPWELRDRNRIFGPASVQIPLKQWREGKNLELSDSFVSSLPVIQEGMTLSVEIFNLAG